MSYFGSTETRQYNTRLQMTHLTVPGQLNISYNFPSANNSQIASQTDNLSGEQITYQYDALQRLYSATGSGWSQSFTYDGFGNLTDKVGTGTAPTNHSPVNAATNQLTGNGYYYDANGNLITTGYGWDPENRMSYANSGAAQYAYDSANKRVWAGNLYCTSDFCDPNYSSGWQLLSESIFFYGIDGKRLASYTPKMHSPGTPPSIYFVLGEERVYFKSKYIGNADPTLNSGGTAVAQDRLGSTGKYFPYGEERNNPQLPNDTVKFASYTRDSATGLDYADQRYYGGGLGRFTSPDPYGDNWDSTDPSSWNMYSYVEGDPINFKDPTGLATVKCSDISLTVNGVSQGTIGTFLAGGSDLALIAETVFTESAMSVTALGQLEMSSIAAVIMNRWQILNGYYWLFRTNGSLIQLSPDWGPTNATFSQLLFAPKQFDVWYPLIGALKPIPQAILDHALNSNYDTKDCYALFFAIAASSAYLNDKDLHQVYQYNGLVLTSFNSNDPPHSFSTWEQTAGSFGSGNVFYGIPLDQVRTLPYGPVPLPPRHLRPPKPPKPPKRRFSADQ